MLFVLTKCAYCWTKRPTFSLKGISQLLITDAIRWESMPVIWIAQKTGEIGPIQPLTVDKVQKHPYSLPEGFNWVCIATS